MAASGRVTCGYCSIVNPAGDDNCLACGAPLPKELPVPARSSIDSAGRQSPDDFWKPRHNRLEDVRKAGEKLDQAYYSAAYAYSLFWRTLAETVMIAVVGFGIGLVGGATGMAVWGAVGATVYGIVVGLLVKRYLFLLLSAPLGVLIGAAFCVLLFIFGIEARWMVIVLSIVTILSAVIGGRRVRFQRKNLWEKARPFLGGLGGLGFGLLGMAIGLGLQAAVRALIG